LFQFISSFFKGSISNIGDDADYKCRDGSSPEIRHKVISGVVGAASSVTSIQVANLLKLFKIPMVIHGIIEPFTAVFVAVL
jgi:metabotropic X receptor